jgi:hypothetical protein
MLKREKNNESLPVGRQVIATQQRFISVTIADIQMILILY